MPATLLWLCTQPSLFRPACFALTPAPTFIGTLESTSSVAMFGLMVDPRVFDECSEALRFRCRRSHQGPLEPCPAARILRLHRVYRYNRIIREGRFTAPEYSQEYATLRFRLRSHGEAG